MKLSNSQMYGWCTLHHHHRFASVSMLAWVGRDLIMALLHNLRSWESSRLSLIFLRLLLINWDHVFLGLPYSRLPSTTTCLQALSRLPASILITCPNHLSLFLRSTLVMSGISNLSLNSSDDLPSFKLTLHIHLIIILSALDILVISSTLKGQISLP